MTDLYAVIRVRGSVKVRKEIKDTLIMLRLKRVNNCIIVPKTPEYEGMIKKARFYITWGEINKETLEKLVLKRGEPKQKIQGKKKLEEKEAKEIVEKILKQKSLKGLEIKPVFRLHPPKKGYKSIKLTYPKGALGYRGEKINELLERMI